MLKSKNNKEIVIWGTGIWGKAAYSYYKELCQVLYFIDNDNRKWGKELEGVGICGPSILAVLDVNVIVALKYGEKDVGRQLWEDYGIQNYTWFKLEEKKIENEIGNSVRELTGEAVVINFTGGLGNQMFQYSLYKNLECQGKHVFATHFICDRPKEREFILPQVFSNIKMSICTESQMNEWVLEQASEKSSVQKFEVFHEEDVYRGETRKARMELLDIKAGIVYGLHQNFKFADLIKEELRKDFLFSYSKENKLRQLESEIRQSDAVSVHIRRGDYLKENFYWSLGSVYSEKYYRDAIELMREKYPQCKFYFFSDDIDWVKRKFKDMNFYYIEEGMFDHYQDWYDMFLMSICSHNIIANSTFSWWGAWLNKNAEKTVIAPKVWTTTCVYEDIYPDEWIQI